MTVADFILDGAGKPFVWGERDCCLWAADWVLLRAGFDPAAELRGRYRTAIGARRVLKRGGGMLDVVGRCMGAAHVDRTDDPAEGDIGLVIGDLGETLGLKTVGGWAGKSEFGVTMGQFEVIAAWRVPCRF